MSTSTFSHFVAILSLLAWAGTVFAIGLAVVAKVAPDSAAAGFFADLGDSALWLGWVVAAVTMAGSLYYSIGPPQFVPCELCWYQRICLYPQAVILLVAALRRDRKVWTYVVPILTVGAAIALYHVQLQAFPKQQTFCPTLTPCTTRYVWEFGFVSLPFMSLAASCFIITMVLIARATDPDRDVGDDDLVEADQDEPVAPAPGSNLPSDASVDAPPDQVGAV
jgi:disulfide bond formation protein DsbB